LKVHGTLMVKGLVSGMILLEFQEQLITETQVMLLMISTTDTQRILLA
jgi:hypothetical protein